MNGDTYEVSRLLSVYQSSFFRYHASYQTLATIQEGYNGLDEYLEEGGSGSHRSRSRSRSRDRRHCHSSRKVSGVLIHIFLSGTSAQSQRIRVLFWPDSLLLLAQVHSGKD